MNELLTPLIQSDQACDSPASRVHSEGQRSHQGVLVPG